MRIPSHIATGRRLVRRAALTAATALALAALTPAAASAGGVRHLPPAEATAGEVLALTVEVARASERTLYLRYRPVGAVSWSTLEFARTDDDGWVAKVPAAQVAPPGIEYFIASSEKDGPEATEFASPAAPHRVGVLATSVELRRDRDLARVKQRRSRVHVAAEYVSYGDRQRPTAGGEVSIADHYYRVDAAFSYRLLTYPLEEIRFGYTRLEGTVPNSPRELAEVCASDAEDEGCRLAAGFKVGGWFELGLAPIEGVRFDARGMFTANQKGFAVGARGELRTGLRDGNHVAIGAEYMADVGTTGFFRLGWDTVPMVAMAATVEVTDMPASVRATGVRLLYDAFVPLSNGLRLGARIGYAARDQRIGGPTAGLGASFDF